MTTWEIRFSPCSPEATRKGRKKSTHFSLRRVSSERDEISLLSPFSTRDAQKVIRSESAIRHIPLDVEIARTLAVDRFPSRQSWFR
jgi:hypothetical protein